jgi:hypothetical protein
MAGLPGSKMLALLAFAAILYFFFTGNVAWALLFSAAFVLLAWASEYVNQPECYSAPDELLEKFLDDEDYRS